MAVRTGHIQKFTQSQFVREQPRNLFPNDFFHWKETSQPPAVQGDRLGQHAVPPCSMGPGVPAIVHQWAIQWAGATVLGAKLAPDYFLFQRSASLDSRVPEHILTRIHGFASRGVSRQWCGWNQVDTCYRPRAVYTTRCTPYALS